MPKTERSISPLMVGDGWFPAYVSGVSRYFRGLHEALTRSGERPMCVVPGPGGEEEPQVIVASRRTTLLPLRLAALGAATWRALGRTHLVDSHFALYGFLPAVFAALRRRPLIVHFHGPWADEAFAEGQRSTLVLAVKRSIERFVYRRARGVVVMSRAFGSLLTAMYGVRDERVHVIPPGVDLDHFSPGSRADARRQLGLPEEGWVAVSARRLVSRVGHDVLLEAWRRVVDEADGASFLVIPGEGPRRSALEAQADALGLSAHVRFLGRVSDSDLVACYRAADVSVVPTIQLEGFGLAAAEALACGTPVIATKVGGLPEVIEPLDPSLVVPPADVTRLARRLLAARQGSEPLPGADRCREHALAYTWDRALGAHLELYESVLRRDRDVRA